MCFVAVHLLAIDSGHAGGALDRFEKSHRPPSPSPSQPSPKSSSDSSSSSSTTSNSYDSYDSYDSSTSTSGSSSDTASLAILAAIVACPLFIGACLNSGNALNSQVYDGLYLEPREPDWPGVAGSYNKADSRALRVAEVDVMAYAALNEALVMTHDLHLNFWWRPATFRFGWEHFYERLEDGTVDHLNILRFHLGANLLGAWAESAELYPLFGVSAIAGSEWTPAFDVGGNLRVYPWEPIAIQATMIASIFEFGPVLLDSSMQAGVALDRFEVRAGPRWLYQGDAQGFWGPAASLAVRW